MIITFVGHGKMHIDIELTEKLVSIIKDNIQGKDSISFYCGGYGDFDNHCATICRKLKPYISQCEIVFITPYISFTQQEKMKYLIETNLYDSIIYPPIEHIPPRFAILKRNEWIVSKADLIIAYVCRTYGGAYKTLEYARRKNKTIINLAEKERS